MFRSMRSTHLRDERASTQPDRDLMMSHAPYRAWSSAGSLSGCLDRVWEEDLAAGMSIRHGLTRPIVLPGTLPQQGSSGKRTRPPRRACLFSSLSLRCVGVPASTVPPRTRCRGRNKQNIGD
jgi:hypothetical protein